MPTMKRSHGVESPRGTWSLQGTTRMSRRMLLGVRKQAWTAISHEMQAVAAVRGVRRLRADSATPTPPTTFSADTITAPAR